jgi:hypothetical protein
MDFTNYKFHPSSVKNLMVKSRTKGELSETTKAYLLELYIKEVWGREKTDTVGNKYMSKGTMCETDSLELLEKVTGKKLFKNQKTLDNLYLVGTPDVTSPELYDIKTSWDIWTYATVDEKQARKDYYYQMLCYMALTGQNKATLTYCLTDTPDSLMHNELQRLTYYLSEEEVRKYEKNYKFDDVPGNVRVKMFVFDYSEEDYQAVVNAIVEARKYLAIIEL